MQALASEMAEQGPGSEVGASRLAEVLFIQVLRAHIASGPERNKGWPRAIFDPQVGSALSAIHDRVNTPWTVESLAEAAGMSRSAFAARVKELLGQTPLEYVTEWRMQKAMQYLEQRDKKLIEVARSVGYESDAAFSKAFKRVVGANPGEFVRRGFTPWEERERVRTEILRPSILWMLLSRGARGALSRRDPWVNWPKRRNSVAGAVSPRNGLPADGSAACWRTKVMG